MTAKATDAAGNVGAAFATPVTGAIDTIAPAAAAGAVTYTNTAGGSTDYEIGDTITLNFTEALGSITSCTINDSGVITAHTHIDGGNDFALGTSTAANTASVILDATSTLAATDTITLIGVDLAGNSATMTFTLA